MIKQLLSRFKGEFYSDLDQELENTKEELSNIKRYFNTVSEPDLIDHAIYLLQAKERKYSYLLKKKKNNNDY